MTHPSQVRRSLSASRVLRKAVWHSEVMDSILGSGDCVCVCFSVCGLVCQCNYRWEHFVCMSFCVCLIACKNGNQFVFVCATLVHADNERCDHRLVCRLFSVCLCVCVHACVCGQCILGQPVWQQGTPQSHSVQQTSSAVFQLL